jgi:hypothetical protein
VTNKLHVQIYLHIYAFSICGFNQQQIEYASELSLHRLFPTIIPKTIHYNYLCSIYVELNIITIDLKNMLHAHTMPFYRRDLSIHRFGYPWGSRTTAACHMPYGDTMLWRKIKQRSGLHSLSGKLGV